MRRVVGERPGLAKGADRAINGTGIAGRDRRLAETEPIDHAGAETLCHDIGALDQRP